MKSRRKFLVGIIVGALLAIAPLFGLLSTAFGMGKAFYMLESPGISNPQGLSVALNGVLASTAIGLILCPIGILTLVSSLAFYIRNGNVSTGDVATRQFNQSNLPRRLGLSAAALHFTLVIGVATWIAAHTSNEPHAPMLWLFIALLDFPAYLLLTPFGTQIHGMSHVTWFSEKTGAWITGEWEPFLAPLIWFAFLGTSGWFLIGWGIGRIWVSFRPHA